LTGKERLGFMLVRKRYRMIRVGLLALLLVNILLGSLPGTASAQSSPPLAEQWRDSGLKVGDNSTICVDGSEPNYLFVSNSSSSTDTGTFAVNWRTGADTKISDRVATNCFSENGLVGGAAANEGQTHYYSRKNPTGKLAWGDLTTGPVEVAYKLSEINTVMQVTYDQGQSYQTITLPPGYQVSGWATPNTGNARAIYLLMLDKSLSGPYDTTTYSLYFSPNAGVTWEKRYTSEPFMTFSSNSLTLLNTGTLNTSGDMVMMYSRSGGGPSSAIFRLFLSVDGGRTFAPQGAIFRFNEILGIFQTSAGLVRFRADLKEDMSSAKLFRDVSTDGGKNWQSIKTPLPVDNRGFNDGRIKQAASSPDSLFALDGKDLWYSRDAGQKWEKIYSGDLRQFQLTPYSPLTVVLVKKDGGLQTLDIPNDGAGQVKPFIRTGVAGSVYFDKVQHNMAGVFAPYWEKYGGLAQFGYPKTEMFREISRTDGKIYYTQYFERNRFEYHPEFKGTPYEVLLGLLGSELTRQNEATNPNFARVENPNRTGVTYFPETGHTLEGKFKEYWERNGGLFVYGYPISQMFEERNPDDGKTYIVQYFERNRFELHPEYAGTQYEVLLGLLGNSLLRVKGWLIN
jgi:hypothetical protein